MAASNEPVKRRAPVKKRLPTEADWKLKMLDGRARLVISMLRVLRKERINSFFALLIALHSGWVPSTISNHSSLAEVGFGGNL